MITNTPSSDNFVLGEAEAQREQQLKLNLDEIFHQKNCTIKKLNEKLEYLQNELSHIAHDKKSSSDSDHGYSSQCNFEPEKTLIGTIAGRIKRLKEENTTLRTDFRNATVHCEAKSQIIKENNKILKAIASHLSSICGRVISVEAILYDDDLCDQTKMQQSLSLQKSGSGKSTCKFCPELTPLCEPINKIQRILHEKDCKIKEIESIQAKLENDLRNNELEKASQEKIINELQLQHSEDEKILETMRTDLFIVLNARMKKTTEYECAINDLKTTNSQLEENIIQLNSQRNQLEQEYNKAGLSQQKLKCKITALESTINRNQFDCDKLCEQLYDCSEKYEAVRSNCRCGAATDFPALDLKKCDQYKHLMELLNNKDCQMQSFQENAEIEIKHLKNEVLCLKNVNKKCQLKITELNNNLAQNQEEINGIRCEHQKLSETEDIITKLKCDLDKEREMHNEQIDKLKSDIVILRKHMEHQNDALCKQNEDVIQLENQLLSYREQCDEAYSEKAALQLNLSNLNKCLTCSKISENKLKVKIFALEHELLTIKRVLEKMNDFMDKFKYWIDTET